MNYKKKLTTKSVVMRSFPSTYTPGLFHQCTPLCLVYPYSHRVSVHTRCTRSYEVYARIHWSWRDTHHVTSGGSALSFVRACPSTEVVLITPPCVPWFVACNIEYNLIY